MKREEQIVQASVRFNAEQKKLNVIGGSAILSEEEFMRFNKNPSFIAGAEWSDENPNEDLLKKVKEETMCLCTEAIMEVLKHYEPEAVCECIMSDINEIISVKTNENLPIFQTDRL